MKRERIACVTLLLGVALLAGCIDDLPEAEPETQSVLTAVNAFVEAEAVLHVVDVGGGLQRLNEGLEYRRMGSYLLPSLEAFKLQVISSNESAKLVDTAFALREERYYTAFVFGTEAAPAHFAVEDKALAGEAASRAGLRFYNLANAPHRATLLIANAEPMAAFSDRPTETPATGKGDAAAFVPTTQTGTHTLTVRDENGEQLARRLGVAIDPGEYLTIFLTGDGSKGYYIGVVRHPGVH